jgi:hypothetical protein
MYPSIHLTSTIVFRWTEIFSPGFPAKELLVSYSLFRLFLRAASTTDFADGLLSPVPDLGSGFPSSLFSHTLGLGKSLSCCATICTFVHSAKQFNRF